MTGIRVTGPRIALEESDLVVDGPRAILAGGRVELEVIKPTDPSHPTLHVLGTVALSPEAAERLALALIRGAVNARIRTRDFDKVRATLVEQATRPTSGSVAQHG